MKKMNMKTIINWLYATVIDRAKTERRPRENREKNFSLYRPVSVPYLSRISLVLLMVALFGVNVEAWGGGGRTHTGKTAVVAGKGTATVKIHYRKSALTGDDAHTGASNSTTDSALVSATYERSGTQDGSIAFYATPSQGYSFSGWYENEECIGEPVSTSLTYWAVKRATSSGVTKIAYAKFSPTDVTFNANGGSVEPSFKTVTDNGTYGTLPVPTRANYTFLNWYTGASDGSVVTSSTKVTKKVNHTLYAHWTPNYTITLNNQSATTAGTTSITVALDLNTNLTSAITTPTKDKNVFDGYYTGTNGSGTQIIDAFGNIIANAGGGSTYTDANKKWKYAGNIELYANWISKYDFEITGDNYTINNDAWSKTGAFTFVHADEAHMTTTIQNSDVISYDRASNTITAKKIGSSKITFTQNSSTTVNNGTIEWTITVDSVVNNLAVSGTSFTKYVDQEVTSVCSSQNSNGTITTTSSNPNLAHYDIANNKIVIPNSNAQKLPFDDVTITISQAATAKYKAKKHTIILTVEKYANTIKVKGVANYSSSIYVDSYDNELTLSADNTDYANCPITNTQTAGTDIATFYQNDEVVYSSYKLGTATWILSQPENYKYVAGSGSFTVTVAKAAEATNCYVKTDLNTEHKFSGSWETTWNDENAADTLRFEACAQAAWTYGMNVYQLIDGNWSLIEYIDHDHMHMAYTNYSYSLDQRAKGVKFEQTGTLNRWVKNVYITRATYVEASNVTINRTAGGNPIYPSDGTGVGTLTINYSLANGGDLKITNDNPEKFSLSKTTISDVDCKTGTENISVSYTSDEAGTHYAHLLIYNQTYRKEVTLTGVTVKHDQSGAWKENIGKLQLGTKVGKPFRSTMSGSYGVVYTSSDATKVAISASGDTLIANAVGTARIYAEVRGDENYYAIRDSIDITVTTDYVQYIVWNQDSELRRLKLGDANFVMNAYATSDLDECSTNGPDAESPRTVTYTSNRSTVVEVVNGNELRIVGVGTAIVLASVEEGEDADGHSYIEAELAKEVVVRDPNAPCGADEIYSRPDETRLDHQSGDRYSSEFSFGGKEPGLYSVVYKGEKGKDNEPVGTVYVEQYIGDSWRVAGSGTIEVKSRYDTIRGTLERTATKIRIRTNGKGHHYFKEISVLRAKYIEVVESAIVKDTLAFSSYIGTPQAKDVEVRWSDSRNDILLNLPEGAPFTLSSEDIAADCNGIDTVDLRITFNTMVSQTDSCYNLVLTDGVTTKTIVLKATATADEVTFGSDGDWTVNDENWSRVPNENTTATIASNVNVTISTEVEVYSLIVEEAAMVTVTPTGGLTIGAGGIIGAAKDNIKIQVSTAGATKGESGYVRISPEYKGEMPKATIETYTKGYLNSSTGVVTWQYMGSPISGDTAASKVFGAKTFIYTWDESQGKWVNKKSKMKLEPFKGYAVSQSIEAGGKKITYDGQLVDVRDSVVIPLQYTESSKAAGCNVIANSFAAPIDISRLTPADFSDGVEATVNLFNTGSRSDIENCVRAGSVNVAAAGQYLSIPVSSAKRMYSLESYPIVIPPMQGFYVNTNKAGSLTLNYERLVWNADYEKYGNQPLRSPKRAAQAEDEEEDELSGTLKVTLLTESGLDHMYLLESPTNMPEYENGYDAKKIMSGDLNVFAVEEEDQLAVDATNSIAGTKIGVRTGDETEYKMTFSKLNSEVGLSLRDKELGLEIAIYEGTEYIFYAEPNEVISERFEIVERFGAPNVTTGNDGVGAEVNAQKFIKDNSLYIYKDGVLFNALGERVR